MHSWAALGICFSTCLLQISWTSSITANPSQSALPDWLILVCCVCVYEVFVCVADDAWYWEHLDTSWAWNSYQGPQLQWLGTTDRQAFPHSSTLAIITTINSVLQHSCHANPGGTLVVVETTTHHQRVPNCCMTWQTDMQCCQCHSRCYCQSNCSDVTFKSARPGS